MPISFAYSAEPLKKLKIVTTTGMIADLARNIGGNLVEVHALMGPGVDPHLYKASQGDLALLTEAQIIFFNGLHLEGKMTEVLEKLARRKPCFAVSNEIVREKLRSPPEFAGQHDPHIWFDVSLWIEAAHYVTKILKDTLKESSGQIDAQAQQFITQLAELDRWTKTRVAEIPKESRVLITAHDAFGYFGRAYEIDVMGLQGISTAGEFGLFDITRLIDVIISRKVKAVFVESSVPERFIISLREGVLAKGYQVALGGQLFSDAMGAASTPEGSYIGMVRFNVNTIVQALK